MTAGEHFSAGSRPAGASGAARVVSRIAGAVAMLAEHLAAMIVIVEIVLLLAGVTSRYVFHRPLVWSDELAGMLFVWLTMLGSCVALARSQHLRLSALEMRLSDRGKSVLHIATSLLTFVFIVWLAFYALEHVADSRSVANAMLDISEGWRAAALLVGLAGMAVICLARLLELVDGRFGDLSIALLLAASIVGGAMLLSKLTGGRYDLLVFFLVLGGVCVLAGMAIAFAFGLATLAYLSATTSVPLSIVASRFEAGMSHIILLSVPMFVVLGLLFEMTGMARTMIAFLSTLIGHLRGGLSYVLLGAMYLVSGISGAKAADMAAIAPALVPEMRKRGIPDSELVSLLAGSSAMSETIPPSLVLITVGVVTGVSIGALFTGGLLPALILALLMCFVAYRNAGRDDITPSAKATWAAALAAFVAAIPGLLLPVIIRTAVVEGIATATEVATIGVVYTLLIAVILQRSFDAQRIYAVMKDTASLSGAIMIILGAANAVSWALTQTGFSQDLARTITTLPGGIVSFWAISIAVFIVFGSLLEGIPAIVVFGPLLFPIARSFGIHEVQYAMVAVLAMGVGLYTPPFGIGYYTACAIARIEPSAGMLRVWPYLLVLTFGIVIVAAVPWISIGFLPR